MGGRREEKFMVRKTQERQEDRQKEKCVGWIRLVLSPPFPTTCLLPYSGGQFLVPVSLPTAPFVYSTIESYVSR